MLFRSLAQYVFDSSALGMVEPIWLRSPVVDGRTGDGINMAFEVGAVGDNMGPMMLNGAFMPAEGEAICNGANKEVRALFRQGLLGQSPRTGSRRAPPSCP